MTIHCTSKEIQHFKEQNEHYWKIIEKQRVVIQSLQKTITELTSENRHLLKRNRELEYHAPDFYPTPGFDSAHVTHSTCTEIGANTEMAPIPPPRSPYRVNYQHNDKQQQQVFDTPKRPPVLKLAISNHSLLQSRAIAAGSMDRDYLISPGKLDNNPISPSSMNSASTIDTASRPSFEVGSDYSSKYSTMASPVQPTTAPLTSSYEQKYPRYRKRRGSNDQGANDSHRLDIVDKSMNSKSEPTTPVPRTPRFDSLMPHDEPTLRSSLSSIDVKVISSSINTDERGREYPVFIISIQQKEDSNNEICRIEKSWMDFIQLDMKLREITRDLKKLPDRSYFATHAPAKVDERKLMIEHYLKHAVSLNFTNLAVLSEFLSSDRIHNLPITLTTDTGIRQGYLTKKGKNFGAWKSRYFVLDYTGSLRYAEVKGGQFIGKVKLARSQIGSLLSREESDDEYRHAFIIVEHKSNGSRSRHIFCAESDEDRDLWVNALLHHTNQLYVTEDTLNSSYDEDITTTDQLILESSSSTETTSSRGIKIYSQTDDITRRQSATAVKEEDNSGGEDDDMSKRSKHCTSNKTFLGKKMSGGNNESYLSQGVTSPQDFHFMRDLHDYDETQGPKQVFGVTLEAAVAIARINDQYRLPAIVHRCIEYMETRGALLEEGIYRLSGSSASIKRLKTRFNYEGDVKLLEDAEYHDVHAIAGLLKMWLRDLPENILTESLLGEFYKSIVNFDDQPSKVAEIGRLVSFLPIVNYTLLRSLCAHLIRVIENSDKTKMTLRNISIVFSATLAIPSSIFNLLLVEFDYIFWTDRCTEDQTVPVTENAIELYIDNSANDEVSDLPQHPLVRSLRNTRSRSNRNSMHYQDFTPKEFISLEKQLKAVIADIGSHDDEPYRSDEELEVAYFATRYNANSKVPRQSWEGHRSAV